ncbi:MAG: type II toxin-antitoxin system ParD family antitoxin [Isosphaeraceae bacterium]
MNVSLTPELEQYVNGKVQSGMYQTASEVVREGLRLLKEREELHQQKLSDLREAIQVGIDQADRGEGVPIDEAWAEGVKERGRERLAARKKRATE